MSYFENTPAIDAWLKKRRAKFSSSENWKLQKTTKQAADQLWSSTAVSYIEMKVIELTTKMYQRPEMDEVEALRHGKAEEFPSFERYLKETKNYSMTYMGDENPMFIPWAKRPDESGGTPDGANIVPSKKKDEVKIDYGVELKNPVNPAYHFRRLDWKTQWDIKEGYPSCYCQIQDLIRLTGADGWDFVSHDDRQLYKSKQIVIISVKPDLKFIDNLELRIELAIKDKYKLLSKHYKEPIANYQEFRQLIQAQ